MQTKLMFGFIKKMFIELLTICTIIFFGESLASNSEGRIKYVSPKNLLCQARPTPVDINSNETLFNPFTVSVVEIVILLIIHMLEYYF